MDGYSDDTALENVTVDGVNVTVGGVVVTVDVRGSPGDSQTTLIAFVLDDALKKSTVATFTSKSFLDFGTANYSSYAEAGYDFLGDLERRKTAPYVTVYCRRTEEGFTGNASIGYNAINPSGLTMKSYFDFKNLPSSTQQAYRIKPFLVVDAADLTNNQQTGSVVTTRLKVRGRGRSMRLKVESEVGKNFVLLGYGIVAGVNNVF